MRSKLLRGFSSLVIFLLLITFSACSNNKPVPIIIGHDSCAWCRMEIVDMRYACELITTKGKVYKFDAIECMTAFDLANQKMTTMNAKLWVHDFLHPNEWLPAKSAVFMRSDSIHSPMGLNLITVKNDEEMQVIKSKLGGWQIGWLDLLAYVKENMRNMK